jgi:uncharacterized OB-fold protein
VYSWIVVHRPVAGWVESALPAVVATVELDEGCRILGRLAPNDPPHPGMRVTPRFITHPGWTELGFVAGSEG